MQITNATYRALLAAGADKEVRAVVGGTTYIGAKIVSAKTTQALGKTSLPVGNCVAAQLDLALWNAGTVPRMAEIALAVRLNGGAEQSEWLPKGTYYVDTREYDAEDDVLTLHAYDAMLKTEQSFTQPGEQGVWPRMDTAVVADIAQRIGVTVDARTLDIMDKGYQVQYPGIRLEDGTPKYSADGGLTMREVLGYIGVMYGGNWVISDAGELRLVALKAVTTQLVTECITASATWTAPSNIASPVHVVAGGGGGGGAGAFYYNITSSPSIKRYGSGGAGGSGYIESADVYVQPNVEVSVTIGEGGDYGRSGNPSQSATDGNDGGATRFGTLLTARGGHGGKAGTRDKGGNGGDGYKGGGGGFNLNLYAGSQGVRTAAGGDGGNAQDGTPGNAGEVNRSAHAYLETANGGDGALSTTGGDGIGGVVNNTNNYDNARGGGGYIASDGNEHGRGGDGGKTGNGSKGTSGFVELSYYVFV